MICVRVLACYESPVDGDTINPRLDDPAVVEAEYQSEARLVRRRLDYWASFEGENPGAATHGRRSLFQALRRVAQSHP